jgi:hypothetical protein
MRGEVVQSRIERGFEEISRDPRMSFISAVSRNTEPDPIFAKSAEMHGQVHSITVLVTCIYCVFPLNGWYMPQCTKPEYQTQNEADL